MEGIYMKPMRDSVNIFQKLMRQVLPILALVLMAGCETPPPSASVVQPWPASPPPGCAMVMIYRGRSPAVSPSIFIDDIRILKLNYNSYTWVYVPGGEHMVQAKFPLFFRGLNIGGKAKFEAGESYYLKLAVWNGGGYPVMKIYSALQPVLEQTAVPEAKRCWFRKPLVLQIWTFKDAKKGNGKTQPNKSPEPTPTAPSDSTKP